MWTTNPFILVVFAIVYDNTSLKKRASAPEVTHSLRLVGGFTECEGLIMQSHDSVHTCTQWAGACRAERSVTVSLLYSYKLLNTLWGVYNTDRGPLYTYTAETMVSLSNGDGRRSGVSHHLHQSLLSTG